MACITIPPPGQLASAPNPQASAWWKWTAPYSGTVTLDAFGSNFDTALGVYTGSTVGNLVSVAGNDDASGSYQSQAIFPVTAGTTYSFAVDGWGSAAGNISLTLLEVASTITTVAATSNPVVIGSSVTFTATVSPSAAPLGSIQFQDAGVNLGTPQTMTLVAGVPTATFSTSTLALGTHAITAAYNGVGSFAGSVSAPFSQVVIPTNDNFANAFPLTGTTVASTGTNGGFTGETGEPNPVGHSTPLHSAWWNWTAPYSGTARVKTAGSSFDTTLGIYSGSSVGSLTFVGDNDDDPAGGTQSIVTFTATAGTTYRIAVNGYNGATGSISLSLIESLAITNPANVTLTKAQVESGADTTSNPDVTNGAAGTLVPYTASGSSSAAPNGLANLSDGDIGASVASDGSYAIPNNGSTVTLDFGSTKTITSIALYNGYANRDDGTYTLRDAADNILAVWTIAGTGGSGNDGTDSFWLTFITPITTSRLTPTSNTTDISPSFREIQVFSFPAPTLSSVVVNGGIAGFAGTQRSDIIALQLNFNEPVTLGAGAFALAVHANNQNAGAIPTMTAASSNGGATWTITFSGANADPSFSDPTGAQFGSGAPANGFRSLADGVYDWTVNLANVHPVGATALSGTGTSATTFHRLFGDSSGEEPVVGNQRSATVNTTDNLDFRAAFNAPVGTGNYRSYFDFNGDGQINTTDNLQFRNRFNRPLSWSV